MVIEAAPAGSADVLDAQDRSLRRPSDYFGNPYGCDAYGGGVQIGHDFVADDNNGGPYVDIADNSPDNPAGAGGIGHDFTALNNAIAKDAVCNPPATTDGPDAPNQVGRPDEGCNAWVP